MQVCNTCKFEVWGEMMLMSLFICESTTLLETDAFFKQWNSNSIVVCLAASPAAPRPLCADQVQQAGRPRANQIRVHRLEP